MSAVGELLPALSTDEWEKASAAGMSDTLPVPFRLLMDPYQTSGDNLPWLAAHHSVDLWFEDWDEDRKREMIAHTAGVSTENPDERLPELKGTEAAAEAYLAYVDAVVVDKVAYPQRFALGEWAVGDDPFYFPPFVARYLVKVALDEPVDGFCVGHSAVGDSAITGIDRAPIERACTALTVSKAPETAYSADFADRVPITLDDGFDLDAGHFLGKFRNRTKL
ncbi:phage tail protein I [Shinella zoogloeoides]|uniref:phage tail protein I n=1 Tax=Shinella zoogloeoides TaxID=352475 RepID=UPI001F5895FF|nr:phage tail protein I [Shinella zoogloeoides]